MSVIIDVNSTDFFRNDSLQITVKLQNQGNEPVKFRKANGLILNYAGDVWSHCFRVYPENRNVVYNSDFERTINDFITLQPGEEISETGAYSIAWLCRSIPPRDSVWNFDLLYYREITDEDNYYLFKSRYSDKYDKEFTKAWTGILESNKIQISYARY